MTKSLKPQTALVLGGGFAGLSAALELTLSGVQVTLLEQLDEVGGKAGEFTDGGFRFDLGPSVWTLPELVTDLFVRAGATPPEFRPLSPLCRYIYSSGRVWDVSLDAEQTAAQLSDAEAEAFYRLRDEARLLYEAAAPTFLFGQSPGLKELARYGLSAGLKAHPGKRLPALLRQFGATGDLETFFLRFATYFGADPYRAPAVLHNIAWVELGKGVFYPVGGIKGVVRQLRALAEKLGVEVCTNVTVTRLCTSGSKITQVETDAGDFTANVTVSGLDVIRTHQLLGKVKGERLEPSLSGFVLLLGLDAETPGLAHHNISFPADYRAEFEAVRRGKLADDPTLYISISSKTERNDAPPGCENWFVLVNAPALSAERPLDWEREAPHYAGHVLAVLARRGLDVRERIRVQKTFSPAYLGRLAHRGAIYGAAPHSLLQTIRPGQTVKGVKNLVLAGGTVHPGGGIPLALLSGKHAAALALSM